MNLHAHLINLPASSARRTVALARATRAGLDVEVFDAIDGHLRSAGSGPPSPLTPGEIGCYHSHRDLLGVIARSAPRSRHLVLEDDVIFYREFGQNLPAVLEELRGRLECSVQVGWLPTDEQVGWARMLRNRMVVARPIRRIAHRLRSSTPERAPWVVARTLGWGTHCYLVSAESAAGVLPFLPEEPLAPIDYYFRAFAVLRPGRFLRTRFPLAGQDWSFDSEVHAGRFAYNVNQLDGRGRLLRRM